MCIRSLHSFILPPLPPFRQFSLVGVPLVDGLRSFLETFRLPGEAPVISLILEQFAIHWLVRGGYMRIYIVQAHYITLLLDHFIVAKPTSYLYFHLLPHPFSPVPFPHPTSPSLPPLPSLPSPPPSLSFPPLPPPFLPPSHVQECNKDDIGKVFANPDAVYVLSYSILMLNTDQHNPLVKNRMTVEVGHEYHSIPDHEYR